MTTERNGEIMSLHACSIFIQKAEGNSFFIFTPLLHSLTYTYLSRASLKALEATKAMTDTNYMPLSNYWDYASDSNVQSSNTFGAPPPLPPRPQTSGLEELWKSYRRSVENKVAKELGPKLGNMPFDKTFSR